MKLSTLLGLASNALLFQNSLAMSARVAMHADLQIYRVQATPILRASPDTTLLYELCGNNRHLAKKMLQPSELGVSAHDALAIHIIQS